MELVLSHLVAAAIGAACILMATNGGRGWLKDAIDTEGRPTCPSCGTPEVSQQQTCHNSACEAYARDVTIYEGWRVQKSSHTTPSPIGDEQMPRKLGADTEG